jgi:hypothetical protein
MSEMEGLSLLRSDISAGGEGEREMPRLDRFVEVGDFPLLGPAEGDDDRSA